MPSRAASGTACGVAATPHMGCVPYKQRRSPVDSSPNRRRSALRRTAGSAAFAPKISSVGLKVQAARSVPPRTGRLSSTVDFAAAPRGKNLCFVRPRLFTDALESYRTRHSVDGVHARRKGTSQANVGLHPAMAQRSLRSGSAICPATSLEVSSRHLQHDLRDGSSGPTSEEPGRCLSP